MGDGRAEGYSYGLVGWAIVVTAKARSAGTAGVPLSRPVTATHVFSGGGLGAPVMGTWSGKPSAAQQVITNRVRRNDAAPVVSRATKPMRRTGVSLSGPALSNAARDVNSTSERFAAPSVAAGSGG